MSEQSAGVRVEVASVTDRGLSQKRPLNEDSMLVDAERGIFAVADGVGGAQAGEVASQTAVEVLGEAFRHHKDGDDIEDLMEIAIQRANASIYQMSHEQRQLSMMATTIVALHLDGRQATIGHVGDSRLYRLTPEGRLERETEDHSVVEEEVRAGRMSPEQAAHHPSRNVISRALGAEQAVEVDLKTMEVEDGTIFLLCSDGITRHIADEELSALLRGGGASLDAACAEMKRLCFERGAEDNLTAVVVRVGSASHASRETLTTDEDERTLLTERSTARLSAGANKTDHVAAASTTTMFQTPLKGAFAQDLPDTHATPRAATNSKLRIDTEELSTAAAPTATPQPARAQTVRSPTGRASSWFGVLLLLLIASAAAFYGGMRYQQNRGDAASVAAGTGGNANPPAAPVTTQATPAPASELNINDTYTRLKAAVDSSPTAEAQRMAGENGGKPLDSTDGVFLALYGRALFLSGKYPEAVEALQRANNKIDAQFAPGRDPVRLDTRMTLAAAALRAGNQEAIRVASDSFGGVIEEPGTGASTVPTVDAAPAPQQPR
ncbi:MAG TPA: PP2C family serine/threonine-protein phosphatase [Pyrinomonadaceae bacterium]|jgi:protein phosphatase